MAVARCFLVGLRRWCAALPLVIVLVSATGRAGAQVPATAATGNLVTTSFGKKMVEFGGIRAPLLWADGITQAAQLDEYARTGFNTIVVRLPWRLKEDGTLLSGDLEAPRELALAAAAKGLHVIYGLPPAPSGLELSFRTSADSNAYFTLWTTWVQAAMAGLNNTPNLLGWMLPDDPRALPFYDDNGFNKWIKANYATVDVLNQQWGTGFASLDEVNLTLTRKLVTSWRAQGDISGAMSQMELAERLMQMNKRVETQNFAFHPAALAMAHYQWEAYRNLLARWAHTVRDMDNEHLVISGRLTDYAQLLSLPADIDISIPDVRPGQAEVDWVTHNPQALDMARRGGRFAAVPVISTSGPADKNPQALPQAVEHWINEAVVHGASGLVFSSWSDLQKSAPLAKAVSDALQRLSKPEYSDLWQQQPIATAAVVVTPLADGYTLQLGPANLPGLARGLYGFAEDMVPGEPSDLVYALRWGTAFGSIDYLSPDDVETGTALPRYSLLLLPQALSISTATERQLVRYVTEGGAVVADLGLGAAQTTGRVFGTAADQAVGLTPSLATLFGVAPAMQLRTLAFNLQYVMPHPLLPTWMRMSNGRPGMLMTRGDGPEGAAFAGPVLYGLVPEGTLQLAQGPQLPDQVTRTAQGHLNRVLRAPLTLHQVGRGYALFAPFRLWNFWRPGQYGFDGFHGDLLARGAALVQLDVQSLVPQPAPIANAGMFYPETVNFSTSVVLLNHYPRTEASEMPEQPGRLLSTVQTTGAGNFLWSGAVCGFPPANTPSTLATGRPAPIADATESETRPRPVELHTVTEPGQMLALRQLPIRVQHAAGNVVMSYVRESQPTSLKLTIWPNARDVTLNKGEMQVMLGEAGTARITIYNGAAADYHLTPGSRHRVSVSDLSAPGKNGQPAVTAQTLTADERGRLVIDATGAAIAVEIAPA